MRKLVTVFLVGLLATGLIRHSTGTLLSQSVKNESKPEPTISATVAAKEYTPEPQPSIASANPTPTVSQVPNNREAYIAYARAKASQVGIRSAFLLAQINHESGFNPTAVSPTNDYGIAQINLPSHPGITKAQAFDPYWSIDWMASNMASKVSQFGEFNALVAYNCGNLQSYCLKASSGYASTVLAASRYW